MRLLFFVTTFPNPSETFIISQIAGMIDRGFDVDIYALSPGDLNNTHELIEDYHLMDRVIYLNQPNLTGVRKFASRLGRIIKSTLTKPSTIKGLNIIRYGRAAASLGLASAAKDLSWKHYDAVIAHFGYAGVYAQKLVDSGILNAKLYPVFHGVELSDERYLSKYRNDYKKLFETSEKVIAISELWCERLINLGCPEEKITLNRMGVDTKRFEFRNKEVTNDRLKVLTTGRLVEKKGIEYAIKAIARLKEGGTQIEYKIIGDGPLKENLIALSNDLGLNDEVNFLGFCSQNKVKELLQDSDVFLLPSVTSKMGDMEGVPVALMEAMAIGLITVSTYHSGIPELIEDKVSGFLAPELRHAEDWDYYLRVLSDGKIYVIPEVLLMYNTSHHERMTNGFSKMSFEDMDKKLYATRKNRALIGEFNFEMRRVHYYLTGLKARQHKLRHMIAVMHRTSPLAVMRYLYFRAKGEF